MASLLERMQPSNASGVVRNSSQGRSSRSNTPYNRPPKRDSDSTWTHDMFDESLSSRIQGAPKVRKANINSPILQRAFKDVIPDFGLNIKGAGSEHNCVEVSGLVSGTSAADVAAIFKRCGTISDYESVPGKEVRVRLTFKEAASARDAVKTFNNQPADGRTLSVELVGMRTPKTLTSRIGSADGQNVAQMEKSVDALMGLDADGGSKLRSDLLLKSERAQVLIAPPGADPRDYLQNSRGHRRGGRGGKRGGGRGRGARNNDLSTRMNID